MNNFEKIKSMTIEEMADFLDDGCSTYCDTYCDYGKTGCYGDCHQGIKKWLESEVE